MDKLHHDINENTKVFAYVRTSTTRQQSGFESQKALIEEYCREHNLTVDEWFEDFGVSANRIPIYEREGYMSMENKVDSLWSADINKRPLVIICNIDRLMRTLYDDDYLTIFSLCHNHAQVISLEEHRNLTDEFIWMVSKIKELTKKACDANNEELKTLYNELAKETKIAWDRKVFRNCVEM